MNKKSIFVWLLLPVMILLAVSSEYRAVKAAGENVDNKNRNKLQYAVNFVDKMDEASYEEASWKEFMAAVDEAKSVLDNEAATDTELAAVHAKLEKLKAGMLFLMDESEANPLPFHELTADELIFEMGLGINLGNTLDGHSGFTPSETAWQSAITTKEYMTALHDAGYNTVRIPVTWGNMIDGDIENGFSINERWLNRVQEIVDYCVAQDMYAIINIHHDGAEQTGWLRVASDEIDEVYYQFEQVWRIIAEHFKDYDEHLIFESMNEITCMEDDMKNSAEAIAYDTPVIMNLNQIFVNVVRSTGSNNTKRWLAAVAHYANNGSHKAFALPTDSYNKNSGLMFAAHIYKHSTNVSWTYSEVYEVVGGIKKMADKFNVPMYLGEWGNRIYAQAGTESGYNDIERAYFSEIVTRACQVAGIVPVVWDQGFGQEGEYETGLFSYWNRTELRPIFTNIVEAMTRGTFLKPSASNYGYNFNDIAKNPEITKITAVKTVDTVSMMVGEKITIDTEVTPESANDVLLWSTENDSVATVYRGKVHAKGIGVTKIHVYSQSGSVEKIITVIVKAADSEEKATITTDADTYNVIVNNAGQINAMVMPAESLSYQSSNTDVVTVNALGKLNGIAEGSAYIVITSASGAVKTVKVEVAGSQNTNTMNLALHVLYNDSAKSYWGCELSEPVTVNGDGTYTLSFDLASQLSNAGKKAGITDINKLTAVYIKDYDVTKGNATKSPVESADIVYNSVKVNGTELTMLAHEPSSCMNAGVFDSGKPVNAWDGSVVKEVSVSDHTATFTTIKNPTTIEVTFTLSDVVFRKEETSDKTETKSLVTTNSTELTIGSIGESAVLTVNVSPKNADTGVTFVTSDASVVTVEDISITPDADGNAKAVIMAANEGVATITALADNGVSVVYTVKVEGVTSKEPDVISETTITPETTEVTEDRKETTTAETSTTERITTSGVAKDVTEKVDTDETDNADSNPGTWIIMALAFIAVVGVVAGVVLSRRKHSVNK